MSKPNVWLCNAINVVFLIGVLVKANEERCPLLCPKGQESPRNCSRWPEAHCVECEDGKHNPYDDMSKGVPSSCIENDPCYSAGQYIESVNKIDGSICGCDEGYYKNVNDDTSKCYECYCCDDNTTVTESACINNTDGAFCSYGKRKSQCTTLAPTNITPVDITTTKSIQHIIVENNSQSSQMEMIIAILCVVVVIVVVAAGIVIYLWYSRRSQKHIEQMVEEVVANCSVEAEEEGKKGRVIFNPNSKQLYDLCKKMTSTSDVGVTQMREQEQRRAPREDSVDILDEQQDDNIRGNEDDVNPKIECSWEVEETELFHPPVDEEAYCPENSDTAEILEMPLNKIKTNRENEVSKESCVETDEPGSRLLPPIPSVQESSRTDISDREAAALLKSLLKKDVKMIVFGEQGCWMLDDKKWVSCQGRKLASCNVYGLDKPKENTSRVEFVAGLHMDDHWDLSMLLDVPRHPGLKGDYRALASCFISDRCVIDHLEVHYLKLWGSPTLELLTLLIKMEPPVSCALLVEKLLEINRRDCAEKVVKASGIDFDLPHDDFSESDESIESGQRINLCSQLGGVYDCGRSREENPF